MTLTQTKSGIHLLLRWTTASKNGLKAITGDVPEEDDKDALEKGETITESEIEPNRSAEPLLCSIDLVPIFKIRNIDDYELARIVNGGENLT